MVVKNLYCVVAFRFLIEQMFSPFIQDAVCLPLIIADDHIGNGEILPDLTIGGTAIGCGLFRAIYSVYV